MTKFAIRALLGASILAALLAMAPGNDAAAQEGQGQYLVEASARLGKLIEKANNDGYVFDQNKFSIGGGWLDKSSQWVSLYTINLKAGTRYRFLASGDADARDVDLDIQDMNGKTLKSDTKVLPEAEVDFTPTATAKYLVRVRLFASQKNLPCLCLAVVMVQK